MTQRVLVIDNYDSFTYNLVQYLGELGADVEVVRNDHATVDELLARGYDRVIVSPGPCTPERGGDLARGGPALPGGRDPTLGVCLGHQALVQAWGGDGRPARAGARQDDRRSSTTAGRSSPGLPQAARGRPLPLAGRRPERCPTCFEVSAPAAAAS